jgi:ParB-like chromosome segregation protein Spo0J
MGQGYSQAVVIAGGFGAGWQPDGEPDSGRLELANLDRLPAREVPVSALAAGPYLRAGGTSDAHVRLLADAAADTQLPPILVQDDGWRVIDGAHRLAAARLRGDHAIRARFVDCTDAEALVLAMTANAAHGLPLSRADRVAGARRVLAAHPDWSDRALAGITGLSAKTIASLRTTGPAPAPEPGGKRLGKDGRRRPVSAADGRRRAADYLTAHPDAPLRQVARDTDVSLGTVHDVSARLRRGISPDRNGHRQPAPRLALRSAPAPQPTDTPTKLFAAPPAGPSAVPLAAQPASPSTRPLAAQPPNPSTWPLAAPVTSPPAGHPAPPPGATPLRRRHHTDAAPDWPQIAAKLANDPAIRYTQGGKDFLRWMAQHATDPAGWRQLLTAIPPHWATVLAPIAEGIAAEWAQFADQLKTSHQAAQ